MILFDPNLRPESSSTPDARASRAQQLPSARRLTMFLRKAQTAVRLRGQVSVLLTTDREIRRLNRQFRGKNKATDVLSFPAEPGPEKLAGDLAISVPTATKQCAACGHSLATELKVLMLHGLLHLAGYDHETDEGQMAQREQKLRAKLCLPQGLIERASGHASSANSAKGRALAAPPRRRAQDDRPERKPRRSAEARKRGAAQ